LGQEGEKQAGKREGEGTGDKGGMEREGLGKRESIGSRTKGTENKRRAGIPFDCESYVMALSYWHFHIAHYSN